MRYMDSSQDSQEADRPNNPTWTTTILLDIKQEHNSIDKTKLIEEQTATDVLSAGNNDDVLGAPLAMFSS